MSSDDFNERLRNHERRYPSALRDRIGQVVERFAEQDLRRSQYLNTLAAAQRHVSGWCKRVGITSPHWVESSGSFSSLMSHMDPIRRDLRHMLTSDLVATDVIKRHNGRIVNNVQYNYNPFRFACSSERERESLMRDLHHELTSLIYAFDDYLPNTHTLERQVLRTLRQSEEFSDWDVQRVSIGHVERESDYALDPRLSTDYILLNNQRDSGGEIEQRDRVAETSVPQHPLLVRETYESKTSERLYSNIVLYVSAYVQRRSGSRERVAVSFDFTIFVLVVEMPSSPRYAVISTKGVTRRIAPLKVKIQTLTPDQWFHYVLSFSPNPVLAAVWYVLREAYYTDGASVETRLRQLDKRIPDDLTPAAILEMLPKRQQEHVRQLQETRVVQSRHLMQLRCTVTPSQCIYGKRVKNEIHLSSRYMQNNKWVIVTSDGLQWAPRTIATFYTANIVARRALNCIIASHMITKTGDFHVSYVSSNSLHDTFF